jgi:hypothetical protein
MLADGCCLTCSLVGDNYSLIWIMRCVHSTLGFVHAESLLLAGAPALPINVPHAESTGIHSSVAPNQINIGDGIVRRLRSNSELTVMGQKPPGASAAVVTPNMSPAIVPNLPSVAQQQDTVRPLSAPRGGSTLNASRSPLPPIPANPASPQQSGSPTPRGGGLNLAVTSGTTAYAKPVSSVDYFSSRTPRSDAEDADAGDQTPGAPTLPSGLKTPDATSSQLSTPGPATPGGGLIGRLKSLGRGAAPPKRPLTPEDITSPVPVTEEAEVVEESVTVSIVSFSHYSDRVVLANLIATAVR